MADKTINAPVLDPARDFTASTIGVILARTTLRVASSSLLHYTKLPDANRAAEEESDREEKMMRQPNNPAGNLLSIRAQAGDFASLTVNITDEERVTTLKTSGRGMPWLLGEKKKIALQLLALEDDIKDDTVHVGRCCRIMMSTRVDLFYKKCVELLYIF